MATQIETRVLSSPLEVRAAEGGNPPRITGYAAVFNQRSDTIMGSFREVIMPGAFAKSIATGPDVRALIDHEPGRILGRVSAGTLKVREDAHGLAYEISPPDTTYARDLMESIKRGDITQSSFSFRTVSDKWHMEDNEQIRELHEVELFDVSPVTYPAYPQTEVGVRAAEDFRRAVNAAGDAAARERELQLSERE